MILYRAVSGDEYKDYRYNKKFRTARNTLEAKQFYKSERGVVEFVKDATKQSYRPPYKYILTITMDEGCLNELDPEIQELDRFEAITIHEQDLLAFNKCVKFVEEIDV
jgi:hypothetical protein